MNVNIKSMEEFAALALKLKNKSSELSTLITTITSQLSSVTSYDGIDAAGGASRLKSNVQNAYSDLEAVATNISNYASSVLGFDINDFSPTSSTTEIAYEDLFKSDGSAEGNAVAIWNFLKYKGLSDAAVAGILGNIQAESGFNPSIVEKSNGVGFGLIQWSYERRTALERAAAAAGVSPSDLQFQLEYLWGESLDPNTSYGRKLAAAGFYTTNSASDAAYYFHKYVEKSADSQAAIRNNRCATAEKWYNKLKGTDAGTVGNIVLASGTTSLTALATTSTMKNTYSGSSSSHHSSSHKSSGGNKQTPTNPELPTFPKNKSKEIIDINTVDMEQLQEYLDSIEGTTIDLPEGLGKIYAYMGWQCITDKTSSEWRLIQCTGMNFDSEGFAKIGDRYVVAVTQTYGNVGDFIDVVQADGTVLKCVIGDYKGIHSESDIYGHSNGKSVVEFIVDKDLWYGDKNYRVAKMHPEWIQCVDKIINKGSYFDLAKQYPIITANV